MAIETTRRQLLISSLPLCAAACRRAEPDLSGYTEEEPPHLLSTISTADPHAAPQLLSGWYQVEQNAWRWTARNFAAVLRPPPASATLGATLELRFAVPDVVITRLKSVTMSASIGDLRFAPQIYRQPGRQVYLREVPPNVLSGDSVRVDFSLSKAVPPSQGDRRELGVIVHSLSLETK